MYNKFEKLLNERKTTIYRVAKDTGIPPVSIYEWRSGRSTPKIDKLKLLADYFGVPISYFID